MKKTKGNLERGITLVALIITIIVMLILVAVTVTVVVDSDIIGQAEDAGELYKNAYANEGNKVSDETIEGEVRHNTIEGYMQDICDHNFVDVECTKCGFELIKFTINGTEYIAEPGMTWEEWINLDYSEGKFEIYADDPRCIYCSGSYKLIIVYEENGGGFANNWVLKTDEITDIPYFLFSYGETAEEEI